MNGTITSLPSANPATLTVALMMDSFVGLLRFVDISQPPSSCSCSFSRSGRPVLALFTVGDVYASLCKRGAYAPFGAQRRSSALFWL